jgi:DNA polymerase I-like protein with 3'-5' exonuclease and polymerase domains
VLATKLNCSTAEAKTLLSRFAAGCPMLSLWHGQIREELRVYRMLTNLLGRKHKFLDRWGDSLFRSAYSYIPQSTVGDLLNRALVNYYHKYGSEDEIALQLHDAIYTIVPDEHIQRGKDRLRECMTIPLTARKETFCIDVDFKVGKSWKDMGEE